jgi:hypothetical protein
MSDRPPDSGQSEDSAWLFTAVGLNGETRAVRVDQLRGAVRLLTPAESAPSLGLGDAGWPPLRHAFIWNPDSRTFDPIDPRHQSASQNDDEDQKSARRQ